MILIYVTHEIEKKAKELSDILLNEKIIACYNTFPIEACYWWQGSIARTGEIVSLLKTSSKNWQKIQTRIRELHPYQIPCIIKIEAEANEEYEKWLEGELK